MRPIVCRRGHQRFDLSETEGATVSFRFPDREGHPCTMPLNDLSASGLSVRLLHDLPGLETGWCIDSTTVAIDGRKFRCDLVVMHVTPDWSRGSVFGALVYPATDHDLLTFREIVRALALNPSTIAVDDGLATAALPG